MRTLSCRGIKPLTFVHVLFSVPRSGPPFLKMADRGTDESQSTILQWSIIMFIIGERATMRVQSRSRRLKVVQVLSTQSFTLILEVKLPMKTYPVPIYLSQFILLFYWNYIFFYRWESNIGLLQLYLNTRQWWSPSLVGREQQLFKIRQFDEARCTI